MRANLPERLERRLAVRARLLQLRRADRTDEIRHVDLRAAYGTMQVALREAVFHRLDLELPLAHVFEVLGRAEEHVDERADERHRDPEQDGHPDEPRVLDPALRVLVDPPDGRGPEDRGEEDQQIADHEPRARAEEV